MNTVGMIPFENMVADYVKDTENHVLYRVTPIFKENNLLASGVLIEAKSVEDRGEGICFCVYVYNVQPGVIIDYSNGNNKEETDNTNNSKSTTYILNTNTHKFHKEDCDGAINMKESNKQVYNGSRNILIAQGYTPCSPCNHKIHFIKPRRTFRLKPIFVIAILILLIVLALNFQAK